MSRRTPADAIPITDEARDGRYQLVLNVNGYFALVRWTGDGWAFGSDHPLEFDPTHYLPREGCNG